MVLLKYLLMAAGAGLFSAEIRLLIVDVLKTTPLGAFGVPHSNQH